MASGSTRYTQDLEAPLTQVLNANGTNYVYGNERLFGANGGTKTWYQGDALGSVRQTLSNTGVPANATFYDPWGVVEQSGTAPFGFTGELTDGGLVNLRARWYSPATGTFPSARWRESESDDTVPYSHHVYAYALSAPVFWTDPRGTSPWHITPLEGVYIGAVIQNAFVSISPSTRDAEFRIWGASKNFPGKRPGFADMLDFETGEVYEIKPRGGESAESQLVRYIKYLVSNAFSDQGPLAASEHWHRGESYLSTAQSFGLWPYGIDLFTNLDLMLRPPSSKRNAQHLELLNIGAKLYRIVRLEMRHGNMILMQLASSSMKSGRSGDAKTLIRVGRKDGQKMDHKDRNVIRT